MMIRLLLLFLITISLNVSAATQTRQIVYKGMNLSGAEFNNKRLPGVHYKDYVWPSYKNFQQMKAIGFNTVRVPFLWGRIQPVPLGELSVTELKHLDRVVQETAKLKLNIVLDVHNYGNYNGAYLTNSSKDLEVFGDLWKRLALRYKAYPHVVFGLMNEPNRQGATVWLDLAQAGVDSIRSSGADQLILVPGTYWTGMHSWFSERTAGSNAKVMININDPMNNYAFEVHQYFDYNYSGMNTECVDQARFIWQFNNMTKWLRDNKKKAFLGEFGATLTNNCVSDLEATMKILNANQDVWIGWTYWAYSDWMQSYMFNAITKDPNDVRLKLLNRAP